MIKHPICIRCQGKGYLNATQVWVFGCSHCDRTGIEPVTQRMTPEEEQQKIAMELDMVMQAVKILDVLILVSDYKNDALYDMSTIGAPKFINKWQPVYDRVMQMKVFL
jgi:hypothetical protein